MQGGKNKLGGRKGDSDHQKQKSHFVKSGLII